MQELATKAVSARRKPVHADDIDISELSSYRLARHNRLMRRARDAEAERLRVSVDEWRLLFVLQRGGPQPSIRLAEAALMDRGTVSRSVARLERRGLVYRLSDATDRRVAVINLTEEGTVIADQIAAFMLGRELEMIGELSEDEWQSWLAITDRFYRFLSAKYGEDG